MHDIYISVNNYCLSSEQLGHRGIDVFVRHKEIFPNYQMIEKKKRLFSKSLSRKKESHKFFLQKPGGQSTLSKAWHRGWSVVNTCIRRYCTMWRQLRPKSAMFLANFFMPSRSLIYIRVKGELQSQNKLVTN